MKDLIRGETSKHINYSENDSDKSSAKSANEIVIAQLGYTLLHLACSEENVYLVKDLIRKFKQDGDFDLKEEINR